LELDGGKLRLEVERVEEGEELVDVDEGVVVAGGEDGVEARLGFALGGGRVGGEGGDGAGGALFVGEGHHMCEGFIIGVSLGNE
jgi:hypothetical protein